MLQHYIPLFIHILSLVIGFGGVIVVDTFGLLWLLKKIPLKTVTNTAEITQRLIWIGWFGLVISGSVLLYQQGTIRDLTWIKLFLVAMLGANGIFLHFIKKSMERLGNIEVIPKVIMFRTSLASTISQAGWWGAMIIGFMNTNTHYRVNLPFSPAFVIIAILLLISAAAIIGESLLRPKSEHLTTQKTENPA